jgi:hypothetical protein
MNRRNFIKNVLYGMAAISAFPTKAAELYPEAFTIDPVPADPTYTGHTNPARCMLDLLRTVYDPEDIDYESFEDVAQQLEGTIPPEVIADGFIIGEGHLTFDEGANRLCDIGDFFVYVDGENDHLVKAKKVDKYDTDAILHPLRS